MDKRLANVIAAVERGEPVDLRRTLVLMALDQAAADRHYAEQAIERTRSADEHANANKLA